MKTEEGAGEKGNPEFLLRNLSPSPSLSFFLRSLTSRGNEVENRILRGSTHLFFTFHEDTNVGFRAPRCGFPIFQMCPNHEVDSRGNRARESSTLNRE